MESHGLQDMRPKPLTTPKRYGAGMAHTVASIGHVLSCCYCELLWITVDYRLSWTIMDYRGVYLIIVDYNGLWTMVDYHGLWTIIDYRGLIKLIMDYGLSWSIVDYCGTLWIVVDYCGFLNMHHHGIEWITRYPPQAYDDTQTVWRRYGAYRSLHRSCAILLLLWIFFDYYGLSTIMGYHGLSWIILDYG